MDTSFEKKLYFITKEDILKVMPPNEDTYRNYLNPLAKEGLFSTLNREDNPFEKGAMYVPIHNKRRRYQVKSRMMMGTVEENGKKIVGFRVFVNNPYLRDPMNQESRNSRNVVLLADAQTGNFFSQMNGDLVSDYRTAASIAVGVEAITKAMKMYDFSEVSILGITGHVGRNVVNAFAGLENPPKRVKGSAKNKCEFNSVSERLENFWENNYADRVSIEEFISCDNLEDALKAPIIIDAMSSAFYGEMFLPRNLPKEGFIYGDANKFNMPASAVRLFDRHAFDSIYLGQSLESVVSNTINWERLKKDKMEVFEISNLLRNNHEFDSNEKISYTIMGVPNIDVRIGLKIWELINESF